jgi:hypothetical protein
MHTDQNGYFVLQIGTDIFLAKAPEPQRFFQKEEIKG